MTNVTFNGISIVDTAANVIARDMDYMLIIQRAESTEHHEL